MERDYIVVEIQRTMDYSRDTETGHITDLRVVSDYYLAERRDAMSLDYLVLLGPFSDHKSAEKALETTKQEDTQDDTTESED